MEHHFFQHMISGFTAGFASTVSLYPLELLKTRMQVIDKKAKGLEAYSSINKALTSIIKNEGYKGLYQGLTPAVIASSASWVCTYICIIRICIIYFKWSYLVCFIDINRVGISFYMSTLRREILRLMGISYECKIMLVYT